MAALLLNVFRARSGEQRLRDRFTGLALALAWAWTGFVFHGRYAASIDFAALVYSPAFLLQAGLLAWMGVVRGRIALRPHAGAVGWGACILIAYALIGYPLIAAVVGHGLTATRVVGLAPGPTAVLTLGLLLLTKGRTPLFLSAVPVLWTLLAGATAFLLGVPEELALPLLGVGALALILCKNRQER